VLDRGTKNVYVAIYALLIVATYVTYCVLQTYFCAYVYSGTKGDVWSLLFETVE